MSAISLPSTPKTFSNTPRDQPASTNMIVKLLIYHEEWMYRAKKVLSKTDTASADLAKKMIDSGKWEAQSESGSEIQLIEVARKPICYYTMYEGPYGAYRDFCYGETVYDGMTIKQVKASHARTWSMGQPQPGTILEGTEDSPQIKLDLHEDEVIQKLKERDQFSEFRKITWPEMLQVDEIAQQNSRINKPHAESELVVVKAK